MIGMMEDTMVGIEGKMKLGRGMKARNSFDRK